MLQRKDIAHWACWEEWAEGIRVALSSAPVRDVEVREGSCEKGDATAQDNGDSWSRQSAALACLTAHLGSLLEELSVGMTMDHGSTRGVRRGCTHELWQSHPQRDVYGHAAGAQPEQRASAGSLAWLLHCFHCDGISSPTLLLLHTSTWPRIACTSRVLARLLQCLAVWLRCHYHSTRVGKSFSLPLGLKEAIGCCMRLLPLAKSSFAVHTDAGQSRCIYDIDLHSSLIMLLDAYSSCITVVQPPLPRNEAQRLVALLLFQLETQSASIELGPSGRLRPEDVHAPIGQVSSNPCAHSLRSLTRCVLQSSEPCNAMNTHTSMQVCFVGCSSRRTKQALLGP